MKIVSIVLTIIAISTYLYEVQTACDPTIVKNIRDLWNNKPPTNLISKYSGSWTLTRLGMVGLDKRGLKCWKQVVKAASAIDYIFLTDFTENLSTKVKLYEKSNEAGVLYQQEVIKSKKKSKVELNDEFHVVFLDHHVAAWYVCPQEGGPPFAVVSIRDIPKNRNKPETKNALKEAEERLEKAMIKIPPEIPTNCPVVKRTGASMKQKQSSSKKKQ